MQEFADRIIIRDIDAGANDEPHLEATWLIKIPSDPNDTWRWCAWYVMNQADVWVNRNLKKMIVPASKFKMEWLDDRYEVVTDHSRYVTLPVPAPEVRMV